MDSAFDVPDATDWLETPLKGLATVENALHCSICKDFYDTPMITSCCHTFCSKCIRTSLSADGKCPACRTADQASKLRNNWALQELVTAFLHARPAALEVARREKEAAVDSRRPAKRKRAILSSEDDVARTTRSKSRRIAASQESQLEVVEVDDSDGDETFELEEHENADGLVACPLGCGKRMKVEAVEPHLDKCEDERKRASRSKSRTPINGFGSSSSFPPSSAQTKPPDRLPELSYSLFNDTKLAKKLKELGVPSTGSKQLMIKRHKEWVNIWNAHCDSNRPRSKRELLQELDSWERTQGGKAPNANGLASTIMRKDFDANRWADSNKSDFSRLIADAKRKKSNCAIEPDESKDDETAGVVNGVDLHLEQEMQAPAELLELTTQMSGGTSAQQHQENARAPPSAHENAEVTDQHLQPQIDPGVPDAGLSLPAQHLGAPPAATNNAGLTAPSKLERQKSQDEHTLRKNTGSSCELPAHLQSSGSPAKKVPMFAVPREALADRDGLDFSGS